MKYILQLQLLSKQHQEWINRIPHCIKKRNIIQIKTFSQLNNIVPKYQFFNVNLIGSFLRDNDLEVLKSCRTINLYNCNYVTNDCTKYIPNCKSLFLSFRCGITALQHLTNIQDLYLFGCKLIDDHCIPYISRCRRLNISFTQVTEVSLQYLTNCYALGISGMYISSVTII